jgi:2-polyprenyl-6-methoxyphenol hydroxylase-like FAD-dependent oxidoreductase
MAELGEHAVVLGASVGGLLAARVLADFYRSVTMIERDVLPTDPTNRRGVPQGRMFHVLQARGAEIMEELLPGFRKELAVAGVATWDGVDFSKIWVSVGGHRLVRVGESPGSPMSITFPSRPLLEWNLRRRVRALPNVTVLEEHDIAGLTVTPDRGRVTGAHAIDRRTGDQMTLSADLVVDTTGRGSRTPAFLQELGYGRPPEDELMIHLAYACQMLRIPVGSHWEWRHEWP